MQSENSERDSQQRRAADQELADLRRMLQPEYFPDGTPWPRAKSGGDRAESQPGEPVLEEASVGDADDADLTVPMPLQEESAPFERFSITLEEVGTKTLMGVGARAVRATAKAGCVEEAPASQARRAGIAGAGDSIPSIQVADPALVEPLRAPPQVPPARQPAAAQVQLEQAVAEVAAAAERMAATLPAPPALGAELELPPVSGWPRGSIDGAIEAPVETSVEPAPAAAPVDPAPAALPAVEPVLVGADTIHDIARHRLLNERQLFDTSDEAEAELPGTDQPRASVDDRPLSRASVDDRPLEDRVHFVPRARPGAERTGPAPMARGSRPPAPASRPPARDSRPSGAPAAAEVAIRTERIAPAVRSASADRAKRGASSIYRFLGFAALGLVAAVVLVFIATTLVSAIGS